MPTTLPAAGTDFEVIVLGGGTAGVIAAIQAGRAGARTLLVEKAGMLGGTTTIGGVNYPGMFFAWQRQIIAGIGWELVLKCLAETGEALPDPTVGFAKIHGGYHVRVDRFIYAALLDEALVAAGVTLLLHTMVAAVAPADDGWQVTLCTKSGLTTRTARVLIDATGDANGVALAGLALTQPDELQPATLSCHASGYDFASLDLDALNRAFEVEVQAGRLQYTDVSWNTAKPQVSSWLRNAGENASHIHHINARDSAGRTRLELAARAAFLRVYRWLRTQPGLSGLRIEHLAPECGVRETVTIVGEQTVTVDDYITGRRWPDAVCYSYYPIDLHTSSGNGIQTRASVPGAIPTIPRGAMIPAGSRNLLVAGRCLASDRLADSALRVQSTCMAVGQAAGALAALSVSSGVPVAAVPIPALHALLRAHGAIVPDLAAG